MIIKRYRNGKVVTEHIGEGDSKTPKIYTKNKKVTTNPRGIPKRINKNIVLPKRRGCGCGKGK